MLQWFQPMLPRSTINRFKNSRSVVGIIDLLVNCNLKMFKNRCSRDGSLYLVLSWFISQAATFIKCNLKAGNSEEIQRNMYLDRGSCCSLCKMWNSTLEF